MRFAFHSNPPSESAYRVKKKEPFLELYLFWDSIKKYMKQQFSKIKYNIYGKDDASYSKYMHG